MNVDFLEFRSSIKINLNNYFTGCIYKISNALFLEKVKDYGLQKLSYSYCFRIKYESDDIGFLYTKSLDLSFGYGFNSLVRIDNKVFYIGKIGLILKTLMDELGLIKTKIKRLDICYDTDTDVLTKFKKLYEDDSSIKFKLENKINVTGTGKKNKIIHIGSISGKKCIAIYNKTLEINNKSQKEYIREIHRKIFGFKNIYRVELRIKERTEEINDVNIMNLGKSDYLETIFNTYFFDLVQFSDLNSKEKVEFIQLNNTGKKLDRVKRQKGNDGGKQIKGTINLLDKESKSKEFRGNIKAWNQIRRVLLKKYELETWYSVKKR